MYDGYRRPERETSSYAGHERCGCYMIMVHSRRVYQGNSRSCTVLHRDFSGVSSFPGRQALALSAGWLLELT